MIAWRYLRSRRAEGGVSAMTWISLVGITLAVFALIATMSVRAGFRSEFVDTILGANAHVTVYNGLYIDENGRRTKVLRDYQAVAERLAKLPGVTRAAPLIRAQVMANNRDNTPGVDVYGISASDIQGIPRIAHPEGSLGDLANFDDGIAIGSGVARQLSVTIGDRIKLISPNG
ncbi:MAG: ABC transporter permease, partial [Paracoccaceae bacterium]